MIKPYTPRHNGKVERRINKITTYRFNGNKLDVKFEGTVERKVKFYNGTEEQIETKKLWLNAMKDM